MFLELECFFFLIISAGFAFSDHVKEGLRRQPHVAQKKEHKATCALQIVISGGKHGA